MFPDPGVTSILGTCGYDYVMIDLEHGPFSLSTLRTCIESLASSPSAAVVRLASQSPVEVKQVLDLGAEGIVAPRVETATQAAAIVEAARYPPDGVRGLSRAVRAAAYGLDQGLNWETANTRIGVVGIIESRRGVDNVEEIAAVNGLDAVVVGTDDLAADLGVFGNSDQSLLADAVDRVISHALSVGLRVGGRPPRSAHERDRMLVACFNDAIGLGSAARQALADAQARDKELL